MFYKHHFSFLCIRGFHWLLLKTITHDSLAGKQQDINYLEIAPIFLEIDV